MRKICVLSMRGEECESIETEHEVIKCNYGYINEIFVKFQINSKHVIHSYDISLNMKRNNESEVRDREREVSNHRSQILMISDLNHMKTNDRDEY